MARTTYVLGTGLSHDGSACLLADGVVVAAIEKERLTRVKHDGGNDAAAAQYVLDVAGIKMKDVDLVVQNENFGMFRSGNESYRGEPRQVAAAGAVVSISHHLAHAYSAFAPSPFDACTVLVVDGCGNAFEDCLDTSASSTLEEVPAGLEHLYFEKDSCYAAADGGLCTVAKDFSPWGAKGWPLSPPGTLHSLGGLYRAFSEYVFGAFDDAGKLMGLAPYGRRGPFELPLFDLRDGRAFVRREILSGFTSPAQTRADLTARFQHFADLARWVQDEVERALLYVFEDRVARAGSRDVAYAGGVALNAVANARLLRECVVDRLYVQPAAGDNGLAVGCAHYGWLEVCGGPRREQPRSVQLGRKYTPDQVRTAVLDHRRGSEDFEVVATGADAVVDVAVGLLAAGKVVGWFHGGSELGPRALGHRSILAHPGYPGLRDHINRAIKFREDFRPFAPSVLAERAAEYFEDGGIESPYMLLVFQVRSEHVGALRNVVHADRSARVQTVDREDEPCYHRLVSAFAERTGLPVLLNTSLNKRGMPIVETPEEAIALFRESALDALVLDDVVLVKTTADAGSARRVRGPLAAPGPADVPLLGARISEVALVHDVSRGQERGVAGAETSVVLRFNDAPAPLDVAPDVYRFLSRCDGRSTYAEIAAALGTEVDTVLELARALSGSGLLDHVHRAHDGAAPQPLASGSAQG
ncbi:carbamoyltransferase family protein [Nocardioides aequoreus]|uniref:carbamoyltransferase family protein n=1 Tax=Nocardioides aequoreus TaxID=397278 RepID=UPI00068DD2D3|nr:carbamoyltransferase C-terminal domain-containing protein [Nocardioides aequoreus]